MGIQPQRRLKRFMGCAQPFERTQVVLIAEPPGASKPRPSGGVRWVQAHAALIYLDGAGEIFPLPSELVGLQLELVERLPVGPVLLVRLTGLHPQPRKGCSNTATAA